MLQRSATTLLLVGTLAHCGGQSEIEGPNSAPVQVLEANGASHSAVESHENAGTAAPGPSSSNLPGSSWQATVARRIAASSFAIERQSELFVAQNPEQAFKASFDARGARIEQRQGKGSLRIGGSALGRGEQRTAFEPASLALGVCRSDGALDAMGKCLQRLEGKRGKVTELWENREDGLEHSFIVHERSPGEGELSVSVAVENARVTIEADGTSAVITDFGSGESYRYSGLRAWDANGTVLAARMQPQPGGLALVVNDARAAYPITIDPVLAAPRSILTGDFDSSSYGISVAGAGDINGDGFDDVIVGARTANGTL